MISTLFAAMVNFMLTEYEGVHVWELIILAIFTSFALYLYVVLTGGIQIKSKEG